MRVIAARGLTIRLDGKTIVDRVDIDAEAGQLIGLIGPNGSGKTTLVRGLLRLQPTQAGEVMLLDRALSAFSQRQLAQAVAYLPQGQLVQWPVSVTRLVALGRLPHQSPWQLPSPADRAAVDQALATTDVGHLSDRTVTTLSGGEKARVMLARAIAVGAPVLIADEPIAALDPHHQLHVMEMLRRYAQGHATVIVVLHDLTMAARFCDHLVLMHAGQVYARGGPAQVLDAANLRDVYRIEALTGYHAGQPYVLPWGRTPATQAAADRPTDEVQVSRSATTSQLTARSRTARTWSPRRFS